MEHLTGFLSFDHLRPVCFPFTAIAIAFFCPTMTTSLPQVTPVEQAALQHGVMLRVSGMTTAGYSEPCDLRMVVA